MRVDLTVNGETCALDVEPRMSLLDCLRERLLLTGAHAGCEHGVCGACTVLLDGAPVRSCLMFAVQADGYDIVTIEGLAAGPGELSPIQDAFCETHAMQCGYCTPAMVLTAHALLADNPTPTRAQIVDAVSANLCRCTGYAQIVEAIALAADRMRGLNLPGRGRGTRNLFVSYRAIAACAKIGGSSPAKAASPPTSSYPVCGTSRW